ncbi:MAG: G5 domain-containing protein [Clostridiales bacterium]|nr:G5 domain-containing protein [Clostridiales bacterium]
MLNIKKTVGMTLILALAAAILWGAATSVMAAEPVTRTEETAEDTKEQIDNTSKENMYGIIQEPEAFLVSVDDDGNISHFFSSAATVGEFMASEGITLSWCDTVSPGQETPITGDTKITIRRGYEITFHISGKAGFSEEHIITPPGLTILQAVQNYNAQSDEEYVCDPVRHESPVLPGIGIYLFLVTTQTEITNEEIPFETEYLYLDYLPGGYEAVITEGQSGTMFVIDEVRYEGSVEKNRVRMFNEVTLEPVNHVVAVGTGPVGIEMNQAVFSPVTPESTEAMYRELYSSANALIIPEAGFPPAPSQSRQPAEPANPADGAGYAVNGNVLLVNDLQVPFSREINMSATAYTADYASTGKRPGDKYFGITASGLKAQVGVVAVDPSVIPLWTKLYIEGYGFAVAGDTGSSVKGNIIDLYFDSSSEVREFGRRKRMVYILSDQEFEIALQ